LDEADNQQIPFHADVKKLVDHILPPIFEAWKTEDDKWVSFLLLTSIPSALPLSLYMMTQFTQLTPTLSVCGSKTIVFTI
jgi:hypothetical protein